MTDLTRSHLGLPAPLRLDGFYWVQSSPGGVPFIAQWDADRWYVCADEMWTTEDGLRVVPGTDRLEPPPIPDA